MTTITKISEGKSVHDSVRYALQVFEETSVNQNDIPQHQLDLEERKRTNYFPWRGQFSPGLVELLLCCYAAHGDIVLDPFAGVGTTVFESVRANLSAIGIELNPAAFFMGDTCRFVNMPAEERDTICRQMRESLDRSLDDSGPFFSTGHQKKPISSSPIVELLESGDYDTNQRNLLVNTLIRFVASKSATIEDVFRSFELHRAVVSSVPYSQSNCRFVHGDARSLPLEESSVDLVVTSPPYINVFNYHQNNRKAMELLGWDILKVARSEFGANRKHRQNRFLTVIQFCLDIAEAFGELWRVMRSGGRAVVVVGRESNVRGIAFQNGRLVAAAAVLSGFQLLDRQERKFKNKFGSLIFEDILHLSPISNLNVERDAVLGLGCALLEDAIPRGYGDIRSDIFSALDRAHTVRPSPVFEVSAVGA